MKKKIEKGTTNIQVSGRKVLENYLKRGKYVFHGTDKSDIKVFKPFQAYNQDKNGKKYKDGKPAVFASITIEIPIFFVLFNHVNIDIKNSSFSVSYHDGEVILRATKNKIDYYKTNKIKGFVYVFKKDHFFKRENSSSEMVCETEVKPIDVIRVDNDDLLLKIKEYK
jgi:hypothetical protein